MKQIEGYIVDELGLSKFELEIDLDCPNIWGKYTLWVRDGLEDVWDNEQELFKIIEVYYETIEDFKQGKSKKIREVLGEKL